MRPVAISVDTPEQSRDLCQKAGYTFPFLSDPNTEVIVHCKMGGRSAKAADFLRQSGFKNVKNMLGGITAWSDKIDPSVPKY